MINGNLFGRPIVFAEEDTLTAFYCELFTMLDTYCGKCGILKADSICALHFEALKKRLQELAHWNEDCCDSIFVVGLGDS